MTSAAETIKIVKLLYHIGSVLKSIDFQFKDLNKNNKSFVILIINKIENG